MYTPAASSVKAFASQSDLSDKISAALALICSIKGYPFRYVTSNAFSKEKINLMRTLGAQLEIIESPDGKVSKSVIDAMISRAAEIAKEPNTFFTNQLSNNDIFDGFEQLGK